MGSSSFAHLVVLGFVLLAIIEVRAEKVLKLHKLEKVVEKSEDLNSDLRIAKDEENVVKVSGELKQHVTIDNEWKIVITIVGDPGGDEEYKEVYELRVCDALKTFYKEFFYEKLKEHSNAPHPDTCPLPPEHYHMEDYPLDVHLLKKLLLPGYYRIACKLLHEDQIKLEYIAELEMKEE